MKKFIPLLLAVFAIAFVSCEKDPDMDKLDGKYLVYTNYDTKADFKAFETYYRIASLLSATVKTPNIGKTKVHRKFSAHTLPI